MSENELPNVLIKGKSVDPTTNGKDEETTATVQAVSTRNKSCSRLKGILKAFEVSLTETILRISDLTFRIMLKDAKDGPSGNSSVNIGGSIERIEDGSVLASPIV